jgi:carboxyl-terminal processing protease
MPDKKMEPEYGSAFAATLAYLGIIEDFCDEYFKKNHAQKIDVKSFSISEQDYADFVKMAMERDIPYKSESRTALEKLRAALAKERNTTLDEALKAVDQWLKDDKRSLLNTFRQDIIELINNNLILRYAYSAGVIEHSLVKDKEVLEAVRLLSNKEEYKQIITKQDTQRK